MLRKKNSSQVRRPNASVNFLFSHHALKSLKLTKEIDGENCRDEKGLKASGGGVLM